MKKYVFGLLTGLIISATVVYGANYLYKAEEVSYTPSDNNWNVSNVDSAINELYDKASNSSNTMRPIKYGTVTTTTTIELPKNIDPSKYLVILNTSSYSNQWETSDGTTVSSAYGNGAYISSKTDTSFTITVSNVTVDYQVIEVSGNVLYGRINTTTTLSDINAPNGYIVFLDTDKYSYTSTSGSRAQTRHAWGKGAYISNKSDTSLTINVSNLNTSYQIYQP